MAVVRRLASPLPGHCSSWTQQMGSALSLPCDHMSSRRSRGVHEYDARMTVKNTNSKTALTNTYTQPFSKKSRNTNPTKCFVSRSITSRQWERMHGQNIMVPREAKGFHHSSPLNSVVRKQFNLTHTFSMPSSSYLKKTKSHNFFLFTAMFSEQLGE